MRGYKQKVYRGTTSRKCTDEIRTCEGLQAESVLRLEQGTTSRKCTDVRICEGLQAESVQMRLEHVRDYKQKVYR